MAPDLTRPSTSQLLWSISLVLARASLAAISKSYNAKHYFKIDHTTTRATEGAIILLPTQDEIAASLPILDLSRSQRAKGTDEADLADLCVEIEDSLERDEGVSMRAVSAPTSRLGKRLGCAPHLPPSNACSSVCVGGSGPRPTLSSKAYLQEKLDKKKWDVKLLCSEEVKKLQSQLTDAKTTFASLSEELTQTDAKLSEQALTVRDLQNELVLKESKSQEHKDAMDGLREEVTQFVGSGMESLVRKLLSSDEFHAALARVASLGINSGVEKGLRMGRTDVEFEAAVQKVSNFHFSAKADFDKALDDFPTTSFPFLSKIVAASEGSLGDVAQILLDKFVR
ncbi:hypothetical protein Tco_0788150 [Tanacetum coccineum]